MLEPYSGDFRLETSPEKRQRRGRKKKQKREGIRIQVCRQQKIKRDVE